MLSLSLSSDDDPSRKLTYCTVHTSAGRLGLGLSLAPSVNASTRIRPDLDIFHHDITVSDSAVDVHPAALPPRIVIIISILRRRI